MSSPRKEVPVAEADQVRRELLRVHGVTPETSRLAETAAAFWAQAAAAHALVEQQGLLLTTPHGVFTNPAVTIERSARLGFLTAVRALRQGPKRLKVGRPMMGEALGAHRFFPQTRAEARRSRRVQAYIRPMP
jgi:hypothetical protein